MLEGTTPLRWGKLHYPTHIRRRNELPRTSLQQQRNAPTREKMPPPSIQASTRGQLSKNFRLEDGRLKVAITYVLNYFHIHSDSHVTIRGVSV